MVTIVVNGAPRAVNADPETPLLYVLRNDLGLMGARFGCGLGLCGACFVQVDGVPVPSCDTPVWSLVGKSVVTIEGLTPHPVQQAFLDEQAAQCGYCVPGIIMSAAALLDRDPHPSAPAVAQALDKHLCRCGAQQRMIRAVVQAGLRTPPAPETKTRQEAKTGQGPKPGQDPKTGREPATGHQPTTKQGPTTRQEPADLPRNLAANPILSRWIRVRADGAIDVQVGKVELGQGVVTALAQIAADELGVDLAAIRMVPASTDGPDEGVTAGSLTIMDSGSALRLAAANVRARFTAAAGSPTFSYKDLAGSVDLDVPADPDAPLRERATAVGQDVPRLDLPDKIFGRPRYIHDMRLPGQLFGRVIRPPSRGARLVAVERFPLPDGVTLVRDGSFLGVVGPDEATTVRAADNVRKAAHWAEQDSLPDETDLDKFLRAGPHETIEVADDGGRVPDDRPVRATYSRPFIAHASMAPSCGIAAWTGPDRVDVWSHSQGVFPLCRAIAAALGLDPIGVRIQHVEGAGCYGHNAADDAAFDAVLLARAVPGRPVQVLWSRQDELSWGPFGSAMTADVAATVTSKGKLSSWQYDVYSQGHLARPGYAGVPGLLAATFLENPAAYPSAVDPSAASGYGSTRNALPGYDLPHRRVTGHRLLASPIRSSAMRALGAYLNVFAIESFMDEAALVAAIDPLDFRLAHLSDPRGRRVLTTAAQAAGWGKSCPDGVGLGLGYARYKGRGAYCAVVAEVEVETDIRVRALTIAVDVGQVVNPDGVRNQIEGGAVQSTSWTLIERVRFDRRQITSDTWETYPILTFSQVPAVAVTIVDGGAEKSVGAGEAAQGPTAAAIGNAVASAAGVRVRDLPLTREAVIAAIERGG